MEANYLNCTMYNILYDEQEVGVYELFRPLLMSYIKNLKKPLLLVVKIGNDYRIERYSKIPEFDEEYAHDPNIQTEDDLLIETKKWNLPCFSVVQRARILQLLINGHCKNYFPECSMAFYSQEVADDMFPISWKDSNSSFSDLEGQDFQDGSFFAKFNFDELEPDEEPEQDP